MTPRSRLTVLCGALLALLSSAPAFGARPHDAAPPPGDAFDAKVALAASQAALGRVPAETAFTASDGRAVRLSDYRGQPLVISLVYTSCHHICPTTTQHLAKVVRIARAALGTDSFRVATVGFDTVHDKPEAMAQFARQQRLELGGWDFLSTDAATLARLGADLGFLYFPAPQGFDHLIQATVLDGNGKIYRQVYGMTFDTPLLVEPLKELVFGQQVSASFLADLGNKIKLFCTVYDPSSDRYKFDYSIFIGLFIGLSSLGFISFLVLREWRRQRPRPRA